MPFRIALSGLNAASSDLRVLGNNVANASTTGFKKSRAEFADIFASSNLGSSGSTVGSGVRVSSITQQFAQGNVGFTESNLDLAINGSGFFQLSDAGASVYTRAGAFSVDRTGFVVNNLNQRLQAFQSDTNGNITAAVGDLQLNTSSISPSATGTLTSNGGIVASLNLDANATPTFAPTAATTASAININDSSTYNNSTSLTVYDSLGNNLLSTMYFRKTTTANEWEVSTYVTNGAGTDIRIDLQGQLAGEPLRVAFKTDGTLNTVLPTVGSVSTGNFIATSPGTGAANLDFEVDFSGTTQYGAPFGVNSLTQDGFTSGEFSSIDIGETGIMQARFTNGQSRNLGQIVTANFSNPNGLRQQGDTTWVESFDSGAALVGAPGTSNLGLIQSGALEGSNVDLTEQLVGMITAQRNFQANAQVISTADAITQTIINIR